MKTIMLTFVVSLALVTMSMAASSKENKNNQKKYEFECGFNTMSKNRLPFSSQFFMVAIMFLVFDLEISMIMPSASESSKNSNSINLIMWALSILTLALTSEWKMGSLEWSK